MLNININKKVESLRVGQVRHDGKGTYVYVGQYRERERDHYGDMETIWRFGLLYLQVHEDFGLDAKKHEFHEDTSIYEVWFPYVAEAELTINSNR